VWEKNETPSCRVGRDKQCLPRKTSLLRSPGKAQKAVVIPGPPSGKGWPPKDVEEGWRRGFWGQIPAKQKPNRACNKKGVRQPHQLKKKNPKTQKQRNNEMTRWGNKKKIVRTPQQKTDEGSESLKQSGGDRKSQKGTNQDEKGKGSGF